jgi:hypothetical protein
MLLGMSGIYLQQGDIYVAMHETPYDSEDVLQHLIERFPEMLATSDGDGPSLVLVRREAGVSGPEDEGPRWSLDHLYLDRDGVPTLVEVKRSSDTRGRREVVAQMLDYAANARATFGVERLIDWLDRTAGQRGRTGAETLREAFGLQDVDAYWQTVDTNLKAERLRLVFVSDRIGSELRAIIEFLNRQMTTTEVLAIEVKQYVDAEGQHQTIVPQLVGDTAEARAVKRPATRGEPLDHDRMLAALASHSRPAMDATDAILSWAESTPGFDVRYTPKAAMIRTGGRVILKLWPDSDPDARTLELHLETLVKHGGPWNEERINQLVAEVRQLGVDLDDGPRWPYAEIEPLADEQRRQRFLEVIARVASSLND